MEKPKLLAIVGPTASGKTALSIRLAAKLNGEILSCDSMQIYRGMDIGTAKPDAEEQRAAVHHLIDVSDASRPFSVADYVSAAEKCVQDVLSRGRLPVFCGGTGLYLDSFLRGGGFEETDTDPALRQELLAYAAENGNSALHDRLRAIDPESAAAIHENNVRRVARALEIYQLTGITKTEADRRSRAVDSPYDVTVLGLRFPDRELLYRRINLRVDRMLEQGLLEETKRLESEGVFKKNATAAQAIGYKELLGYLHGEESLADAVEELKRASRRYAKRQMTWFSAKPYVKWIDVTENGKVKTAEALEAEALSLIASDKA